MNGVRHSLQDRKFDHVNDQLAALNEALTILDDEEGGETGGRGYSVESIERPRRRAGGKIVKRLSYVEHSYQRLTNDTYSTSSSLNKAIRNTTHLDEWVS